MNPLLLLIPLIPAVTAWLMIRFVVRTIFKPVKPVSIAGFSFQGIIPKNRERLTTSLAKAICTELFRSDLLQKKLTEAETLNKTLPLIESHIDNFLNHKLKTAIPVISMFVGEKIIQQLKELFIEELKELFPSVMSQFISGLSQNHQIEDEMVVKLNRINIEAIESHFYTVCKKDIKKLELFFAAGGFITGVIQLLVLFAFGII